jgi:hypothetical protein
MLKDQVEKKINVKNRKKKLESTWLTHKTRDPGYKTEITL